MAAFRMRHGAEPRILGEFQRGNLGDDGEEIVVNDSTGARMWRFTYNDAGAWPDTPDGEGPALVLVDPDNPPDNTALSSPESWRSSAASGGAPGRDDRTFLAAWLAGRPESDPLADPDGDGINQLLAFTIGALERPDAHDFLPSISFEEIDVAGSLDLYPVMSVRLLTGGGGIAASLKVSSGLASWDDANLVLLSNTGNGDGTMTLRYRSTLPYDPDNPTLSADRFYRLSVTALP
jgi:hypothetical protein